MTQTRKMEISMARRAVIALLALALAIGACRGPGEPSTCATPPPNGNGGCGFVPTTLKVGLGYIPSVQFAQFYLAEQAGYYREAGLAVTFENKIDPDLVTLVGQGALDIGVADGTSVVPAVGQDIPIKYVTTIYGTYPSIVFAKASSGITSAADLEGKRIGIPGKYGSSWIMLQALLSSAGLTPDDVTIVEYPDFGQGVAVQADVVDAATGFANNEPVQLELTGSEAVVLHVDDIVPLPGPGLIVGTATLDAKRDAIASFQNATLQAMEQIALDPAKGVDAAIIAVPELGSDRTTQEAILDATIATWAPPGGDSGDFGSIDRAGWEATVDLLVTLGIVPNPVPVDRLVEAIGLPAD